MEVQQGRVVRQEVVRIKATGAKAGSTLGEAEATGMPKGHCDVRAAGRCLPAVGEGCGRSLHQAADAREVIGHDLVEVTTQTCRGRRIVPNLIRLLTQSDRADSFAGDHKLIEQCNYLSLPVSTLLTKDQQRCSRLADNSVECSHAC